MSLLSSASTCSCIDSCCKDARQAAGVITGCGTATLRHAFQQSQGCLCESAQGSHPPPVVRSGPLSLLTLQRVGLQKAWMHLK